jgi:alpha-amylase
VADPGGPVTKYDFFDFTTANFHNRCDAGNGDAEKCWLSDNLMDLRTESDEVRGIAKACLTKLVALGADGFRFDAAKNIEQSFFPAVMTAVTGKYAFGEFPDSSANNFNTRVNDMDYYDFPLAATMKGAFAFGGDLGVLTHPNPDQALQGPDAVTFVRTHDLAYYQVDPRHGMDSDTFGIGWDRTQKQLNRTDVLLAYAFIFAREEGLPYVFVGMKGAQSPSDDPDNDPDIVAAIRFHNLCLDGQDGIRRADNWFLGSQNAVGLTRGDDRFGIINKAAESLTTNLPANLQPGSYKNVRTGDTIQIQQGGGQQIQVNGRTAAFFVKV